MPWRKWIKTSNQVISVTTRLGPFPSHGSFPISMLTLSCPRCSFIGFVRQEPGMPTLPLTKHLSQQGQVEAFRPTQISHDKISRVILLKQNQMMSSLLWPRWSHREHLLLYLKQWKTFLNYDTMAFRHWKQWSGELWFLRRRSKGEGLYSCYSLLPEVDFQGAV
jgi:hypothetical protein